MNYFSGNSLCFLSQNPYVFIRSQYKTPTSEQIPLDKEKGISEVICENVDNTGKTVSQSIKTVNKRAGMYKHLQFFNIQSCH